MSYQYPKLLRIVCLLSIFFANPGKLFCQNLPAGGIEFKSGTTTLKCFLGLWQNVSGNPFFEEWQQLNDSTIIGKSYEVRGKDTLVSEQLILQIKNSRLYYIFLVMGQNNGKPVYFVLNRQHPGGYGFSNPQHDFPQQIDYVFNSSGALTAEISGNTRGVFQSRRFHMRRLR